MIQKKPAKITNKKSERHTPEEGIARVCIAQSLCTYEIQDNINNNNNTVADF
ncbi:hypothetical protein O9929_16155 [Vibrio lentus]|nr:hypothetical protein [Vibrio lentus]